MLSVPSDAGPNPGPAAPAVRATAVLIDPTLSTPAGHHHAAIDGWAAGARARGFAVRVLGNEAHSLEAIDGRPVERTFRGRFYDIVGGPDGHDGPRDGGGASVRRELRALQREVRDALGRALQAVRPDDVLILAHATLATLNGLAAWSSGLDDGERPRLAVWLMVLPAEDEFAQAFGTADGMASALDRLRALHGSRLTVLGGSPEICRAVASLGCGEATFLPFIALRQALDQRPTAVREGPQDREPVVAVAGHFRAQKGLALLPAIMRNLETRGLPVRWIVAGAALADQAPDLAAIAGADPRARVTLRDGAQDAAAHAALLAAADLILLPYPPPAYAHRGSGIAEEAEVLGVPYVAPRVPFSASAAAAGAAVTFDEGTPDAVAAALAAALRTLPARSSAAAAFAPRAAAAARARRESVLDAVLALDPPHGARPAGGLEAATTTSTADPSLPAVDVIVTVHNYRRFLPACLESIARQTWPRWRCIVVDDASDDIAFAELRSLVARHGPRFTLERHHANEGQIPAIASGLALGTAPFVVTVDADDELTPQALDLHLAWHLNGQVPVAVTSGRALVVDGRGRLLAGALDNIAPPEPAAWLRPLPREDGFARPGAAIAPPPATFVDQTRRPPPAGMWCPTSALMFRRATVELVLPDDIDVGRYGADTVLAVGAHVLGGSILLAAPVALYRRHGANSHSDMPVHGACAMPVRTVAPTLERVIRVLAEHIARHHDRLAHEVGAHHLARVLQHAGLSLLPGAAPWWLQGVDPDGWAGRRLSVAGVFPAETTGLRLSLEVPGWPAAPPHVAAAITRDAAAPLHLRLAPGLWTIALPAGGTGRLERTTIDLAPDTAMPGEQRRRTVRVLQIAQAMPGDGFVPWQVERFGPEC